MLATVPNDVFERLLDPALAAEVGEAYLGRARGIEYFAALCLLLELDRPFSPYYWTNVADRALPFVGPDRAHELRRARALRRPPLPLRRQLPAARARAARARRRRAARPLRAGLRAVNPAFSRDWVERAWRYVEPAAQPIVTVGYGERIPPLRTPAPGLVLANTTQVYPEDRGTNGARRAPPAGPGRSPGAKRSAPGAVKARGAARADVAAAARQKRGRSVAGGGGQGVAVSRASGPAGLGRNPGRTRAEAPRAGGCSPAIGGELVEARTWRARERVRCRVRQGGKTAHAIVDDAATGSTADGGDAGPATHTTRAVRVHGSAASRPIELDGTWGAAWIRRRCSPAGDLDVRARQLAGRISALGAALTGIRSPRPSNSELRGGILIRMRIAIAADEHTGVAEPSSGRSAAAGTSRSCTAR